MISKYDYVIIGSGLFGSIFAHEAYKLGKKVIVLEKRNHIGGNCYTEKYQDYHLHKYGAHIFHTSQKYIWDYVNQFTEFYNYSHRVKANINNKLYSMPINLLTINQIWPDIHTPEQAKIKIQSEIIPFDKPKNLEEHILSQIGPTLYYKFIYGYTKKQWGKDPKFLPASIIKRIPVRYNLQEKWYHNNDIYEGLPKNGYTELFENLLKNIEVLVNEDFFENRSYWESSTKKIVYSGQIQQYFDFMFGDLEYRTLNFVNEELNYDLQGNSVINYPSENEPWTRILQHRYFTNSKSEKDYVTYEYPSQYDRYDKNQTPYYPINTDDNNTIYAEYKKYAESNCKNLIIGGRLGNYRYYDMDMTVANALNTVKNEFKN